MRQREKCSYDPADGNKIRGSDREERRRRGREKSIALQTRLSVSLVLSQSGPRCRASDIDEIIRRSTDVFVFFF